MIFFLFEQKSPQREIRKEVWNVLRPKKLRSKKSEF